MTEPAPLTGGGTGGKILVYLEPSPVRGGIEVFAERHVARLRAEGRTVDICRALGPAAAARFAAVDEIIIHKCTDVATLERFPPEKTTCYIHDHEPICPRGYAYTPLLHNCTRPGGLWPCLLCAPACRSWRAALARVFTQSRRTRALARFNRLVVISEFMKGRLVANGLSADRIVVAPPVIAPPPAGAPPPDAVDLLFVGQLIRGKGVQLLLDALARLPASRTLDIVGTGNREAALRAQADRLGLATRVRFRGFQPDPSAWMRAARCVVVPSFWQEPYGLVAAEAVALGRPVVAFAIGGLPEACQGRATLVPPGDVAALAAALAAHG